MSGCGVSGCGVSGCGVSGREVCVMFVTVRE